MDATMIMKGRQRQDAVDLLPGWEARAGARVKLYRKAHGLIQDEVAHVLGINRDGVSKIESGMIALSLDKAMVLCRLWKISLEDLTGFEAEPETPEVVRLRLLARRLPPQGVQALIAQAQVLVTALSP